MKASASLLTFGLLMLSTSCALQQPPPATATASEGERPNDAVSALVRRAHEMAPTDPAEASRLLHQALQSLRAAPATPSSSRLELAVRWYRLGLLRVALISGTISPEQLGLYRNELADLDTTPPDKLLQGTAQVFLLELALLRPTDADPVVAARRVLASFPALTSGPATALESGDVVSRATVRLLAGIALGRVPEHSAEARSLLSSVTESAVDPRFRLWLPRGHETLVTIQADRQEFGDALRMLQQLPEAPGEELLAKTRAALVVTLRAVSVREHEPAKQAASIALALVPQLADPVKQGYVLVSLVGPMIDLGHPADAESLYGRAMQLLGTQESAVSVLFSGLQDQVLPTVDRLRAYDTGVQLLEKTLALPLVASQPSRSMTLYPPLARYYGALGNGPALWTTATKAFQTHWSGPKWDSVIDIWLTLSSFLRPADPAGAAAHYVDALRVALVSAPRLLPAALRRTLDIAVDIGRYQDAMDFAMIAAGLGHVADRSDDLVLLLVRAGEAMTDLGHFDLAHGTLTLALVHAPTQSDLRDRALLAVSKLHLLTGDIPGGLHLLGERSRKRSQPTPADRLARYFAEYEAHLGETLHRGGDLLRAEQAYENCVELVTGLWRLPETEAMCRAGLVEIHEALGEWASRNDQLKRMTDTVGRGASYSAVAALYSDSLGRLLRWDDPDLIAPYIEHLRQAFATAPPTVPVLAYRLMFDTLHEWVQWRRGGAEVDISRVRATLALLSAHPYWSTRELGPLMVSARLLQKVGRQDLALTLLNELLQRVELARALLDDDRMRVTLEDAVRPPFDFVVDLHLSRGSLGVVDALTVHEANRGRAAVVPGTESRTTALAQEQSDATDACRSRRAQLAAALKTSRSDVGRRTGEFLALILERGGCTGPLGPTAGAAQRLQLPDLDLRGIQGSLGKMAAIIVFRLRGTQPGAWVITEDKVLWRASAPLRVVEEQLLQLRTAISSPDDVPQSRLLRAAQLAYRGLLEPLAGDLVGKTRLVVIPDGRLFEVPLEAFMPPDGPDAGRFLVETHEVSYHISLAGLRPRRTFEATAPHHKVLLMGDPLLEAGSTAVTGGLAPLPGVRQELNRLRQTVGVENSAVYTGPEATRAALQGSLSNLSVLHLATHGVVNERDPWGSYLLLSPPDPALTVWDLRALRIPAHLVVLSACDTGRGRLLHGQSSWGFATQFLRAGTKNVVVSVWRVEDASTATLMEAFYRGMGRDFSAIARSLRDAKLSLLAEGRWAHPYYWAPFIHYGPPD
jgi:CHAT domain-containing protein/tetratricopeptide (TPR) repeat protein